MHHNSQLADTSNPQPLATNSRWSHPKLRQCAVLAIKDHPGQLVRRERLETMARMETMERMDRMERMHKHCQHHTKNHALYAQRDHLAHKAKPDRKDHLDQKDHPENRRVMEFLANKECKDSPDQSDVPAVKDRVAHPASPVVLFQCLARKDQLDHPDRQESKDPRDNPDQTDNPSRVHPARPVMPASLDVKDALVELDRLDHLAKMARREAAIIAQSHAHRPATLPRLAAIAVVAVVELATTSTDKLISRQTAITAAIALVLIATIKRGTN